MSPAEKIRRLFAGSNVTVQSKVDDRIVGDALTALDKSEQTTPVSDGPNLWRIIMRNRMTKLAAAAVLIVTALVVINQYGGSASVSGVAFGDVLRHFHNSSYTFDVTTVGVQQEEGKIYLGMIRQSDGMRIDFPEEGVSSIINFNTDDGLVLFHGNKIAITDLPDKLADSGPFAMFRHSIENLWNLQDGTEKSLGQKEIDGQPAVGFEVRQKTEDYNSGILCWAHEETGVPIRVEITLYSPDESLFQTVVMSNIKLNADLDEGLFSTEPPEGYKVATYQQLREDPASVYRRQ